MATEAAAWAAIGLEQIEAPAGQVATSARSSSHPGHEPPQSEVIPERPGYVALRSR